MKHTISNGSGATHLWHGSNIIKTWPLDPSPKRVLKAVKQHRALLAALADENVKTKT